MTEAAPARADGSHGTSAAAADMRLHSMPGPHEARRVLCHRDLEPSPTPERNPAEPPQQLRCPFCVQNRSADGKRAEREQELVRREPIGEEHDARTAPEPGLHRGDRAGADQAAAANPGADARRGVPPRSESTAIAERAGPPADREERSKSRRCLGNSHGRWRFPDRSAPIRCDRHSRRTDALLKFEMVVDVSTRISLRAGRSTWVSCTPSSASVSRVGSAAPRNRTTIADGEPASREISGRWIVTDGS